MPSIDQYPATIQDADQYELQSLSNEEIRQQLIEELGKKVGQTATDATFYIENN
jgi:hypothetical protein